MLPTTDSREKREVNGSPIKSDTAQKEELRRQMYARIARGNALAEAEENARRKLRGN